MLSRNHRLILGIETSCDETAAALYCSQTKTLLAHTLYSQMAIHAAYGGVIPELASRGHLHMIGAVVAETLERAHISLQEIDVIAATSKPGLVGSLLIGLSFAKAVAASLQKPFIAIDHIEGHIFSSYLTHPVPFPHLCITASGGHTSLYLVSDFGNYRLLGNTTDDAAGEAFDKIAKIMGLPYPGGPVIERYAGHVAFQDFFNYPRPLYDSLNFSFSGLKTAVLYHLVSLGCYDLATRRLTKIDETTQQQIASSTLVAIADILTHKIVIALQQHNEIKAVSFVGGVACNRYINNRLQQTCTALNIPFYTAARQYCTDNGAMIAFVAAYKAEQGLFSELSCDVL